MTHDQTPHDALDAYLDALARDPDATPPPELDAETVAFARLLVADRPEIPEPNWGDVLGAVNAANNGHLEPQTIDTQQEWEQDMASLTYPREKPTAWLTLAAVLVALLLFGSLILFAASQSNGPRLLTNGPLGVIQQEVTPTSTPTSVPLMTATPIPPTTMPPPTAMGGSGGGGGGLTLNDIFAEIPPQPIVPDQSYTVTLDGTAPYATFDYVATDDELLLTVVDTSGIPASFRMSVMSAPADGLFGGGGGGGGGGPLRGPRPLLLNDGDTLQVAISTVTGHNLSNGTVSYTVRFVDVEPMPITLGEPVTAEITADQPYAVYTFPAESGQMYTMRATGENGFDTALDLSSRGGRLFSSDSDSGPGLNPEIYRLPNELAATGYLLVAPEYEGDTGTVTVTLEAEPAPDITQSPVMVRVTPGFGSQMVRASGEPGAAASVAVRSLTGDASLSVSISDGETVLARTTGENVSQLLRDFTYPESGEVIISVGTMGSNVAVSELVEIALTD